MIWQISGSQQFPKRSKDKSQQNAPLRAELLTPLERKSLRKKIQEQSKALEAHYGKGKINWLKL